MTSDSPEQTPPTEQAAETRSEPSTPDPASSSVSDAQGVDGDDGRAEQVDTASVEVQTPPEGRIFGSDLEAALDEKIAAARAADGHEVQSWQFRGVYYKLRPTMPGSIVLTSMELANEKRADKLVELIKAFFADGDGDRFLDALKPALAEVSPSDTAEILKEIVEDLFGIYGNRPLDK